MKPRAAVFYFYSFHPYAPIRSVCEMVIKAIQGKQSEIVGMNK